MAGLDEAMLEGVKVLILEDEFFLADDLAQLVRKVGGTTVGPASTIHDAEELIRNQKMDAAIVDLNLRGTMAFEFVKRLATAGLPCVIVSGYGEDALPDNIRGITRLEKPVSPAAVIEALSAQLSHAQ